LTLHFTGLEIAVQIERKKNADTFRRHIYRNGAR
jgi:hypothetical protein